MYIEYVSVKKEREVEHTSSWQALIDEPHSPLSYLLLKKLLGAHADDKGGTDRC